MSTIGVKRKRDDGANEPDGGAVPSSDRVWFEDHGGSEEVQCEDDETVEEMVARQRQALLDVSILKLCQPPPGTELGLQRHVLISGVIRRIHDDIRQEAGVMYVVQASPTDPSSYFLVPALLLEEPPDSEDPLCLTPDENPHTATSPSLYDDVAQEGWSSQDSSPVHPKDRWLPPPSALVTEYVLDDVLSTDASLYDPGPLPSTKHTTTLQHRAREVRPLVATVEEEVEVLL